MAFCTNCGAQVPDGTKFCPSCGQKIELKEQASATIVPPVEQPAQQSYTPPTQQSYTPPTQQSYTQPTQQSYTPPAQQSYTPPTQQSYTPPTQQSYTPPTQQSYTPPTQQEQPNASYQQGYSAQPAFAAANKQKKPANKKTLFIIGGVAIAVIILVVLVLLLTNAFGSKDTNEASDPNLGVYTAATAEMMGIETDVSDLFEKGVSIELKANGKCAMNVDGTTGNGKWSLDDGVFHVKGGGFDCDGTLANGVMTLENILNMGVTLTLQKDGASPSDAPAGTGSGVSALQTQWNGTWYGCLYVKEATGSFSGIPHDFYDVYMIVDVDGEGKGQFAVYLANVDEAFATGNCQATEAGLNAIDGTVAGGVDMYAYNWMFLPMPDYPDQYTMSDSIENGDSLFEYTLFMKQWGGSWQKEIDSDFNIVPPSVDSYMAAIENGELPPVGFAPSGYEGASAPSDSSGSSDASGSSGGDLTLTGETDVYNYFDEIYVSYPVDSFTLGSVNGLEAIIANDGSIEISIDVKYNEGGHDYTMQYLDGLSSEQDYKSTNMTIAGYDTRCVTYCDPSRLRPYYADYHVCFKDKGYANYGINFYVTSAESADVCTSDIVLAILNTLTIAK